MALLINFEKMLRQGKTRDEIPDKVIEQLDREQAKVEKEKKLAEEQKEKAKIIKNNLINDYIEYIDTAVSSLTNKEKETLKVELSNVNNATFNSLIYSLILFGGKNKWL